MNKQNRQANNRKVSIIIPLFNGEKTIERTINSCLLQTYIDLEILILDDCSTDDSVKIVRLIEDNNPRVKLIQSKTNNGLCKNDNIGIRAASGDYIVVLGQDDILKENHIEVMINCFDNDVVMAFCDCDLIDEDDNIFDHCKGIGREVFTRDFIKGNVVSSCGAMIKKSAVLDVGGFPEFDKYPNYGEWYLWILLSRKGRIVFCNDVVALYRRHNNNISNSFNDVHKLYDLNNYWNLCRKLAVENSDLSFCKKMKMRLYVVGKKIQTKLKYRKKR